MGSGMKFGLGTVVAWILLVNGAVHFWLWGKAREGCYKGEQVYHKIVDPGGPVMSVGCYLRSVEVRLPDGRTASWNKTEFYNER